MVRPQMCRLASSEIVAEQQQVDDMVYNKYRTNIESAPCGLRGCKNRPALFRGRIS